MGDKYVGLDVHQSSTVAAVLDEKGRLVMESVLETKVGRFELIKLGKNTRAIVEGLPAK